MTIKISESGPVSEVQAAIRDVDSQVIFGHAIRGFLNQGDLTPRPESPTEEALRRIGIMAAEHPNPRFTDHLAVLAAALAFTAEQQGQEELEASAMEGTIL